VRIECGESTLVGRFARLDLSGVVVELDGGEERRCALEHVRSLRAVDD